MLARIQKGDTVVVISGKEKGKTGKVARVMHEDGKVVIEGLNLVKRHMKPTSKNPQGGILEKEAPMHASKVMPVDPKTGKGTRVKMGKDEKGKKVRLAKSGDAIVAAK